MEGQLLPTSPHPTAPAGQIGGEVASKPRVERLASLDAIRGFAIACMILVNNPGSWSYIYRPFSHAEWHGWNFADLGVSAFLCYVGVSLAYAFPKQMAGGATNRDILLQSARRASMLILLGLFLHSFPWFGFDFSELRIPGVLQRIGLSFFVATILVLWLSPRMRAMVTAAILLGYWALMSWVPVPGIGAGVMEPGKNLSFHVDQMIFGVDHLLSPYGDPEGLFGSITAVAAVLIGVHTGEWLRSSYSKNIKAWGLFLGGLTGMAIGTLWDPFFPIIKPIGTSSMVLVTVGGGLLWFWFFYYMMDVRGIRFGTAPLTALGSNAIGVYCLSILADSALHFSPFGEWSLKDQIFGKFFVPYLTPYNASLAFGICMLLFWSTLAYAVHRKGVRVKV